MTISKPSAESAAFSRELNEFLLELGLALQRYALYPGGHPSIDAAVAALVDGLEALLREREILSLGVARRQLIVEGIATEDTHPVLRTVAERLHRHRVGVVSFRRGLTREELSSALREVSRDPERSGDLLGMLTAEQQARWPHVRFHALAYDHLQLAARDDAEGNGGGRGGLAAQLWLGLARAALAKERLEEDAEPAQVARAINERTGVRAYDQVIVGYMLQLTDELQGEGEAGLDPVRARVSAVMRELEPGTLDRLLEMGGDAQQRARFLHGAVRGLRPDAVLELVSAAARAEGQNISTSLLRLLRKLSAVAHAPQAEAADHADTQLRDQVRELLVGWSLADPNPDGYTAALDSISRLAPDSGRTTHHPAEPLRLVQMAMEVGVVGVPLLRAVEQLLESDRVGELYPLLEAASSGNPAVQAVWGSIEKSDMLRVLLTTDPVNIDQLNPMLRRLPLESVISLLLDRLSESESRATRMALFRRLVSFGLSIVLQAVERLGDPRWYVQRNMLALLHEIDAWPGGQSLLPFVQHAEARVRREAVGIAVRVEAEREAAIVHALSDSDERVVRVGTSAARQYGLPKAAAAAALERIHDPGLAADVQVVLIRLLAPHMDESIITSLLPLVVLPRTLLRGARLAPVSTEMLAAVACFAASRSNDARVRQALTLARASRDPRLARALSGVP